MMNLSIQKEDIDSIRLKAKSILYDMVENDEDDGDDHDIWEHFLNSADNIWSAVKSYMDYKNPGLFDEFLNYLPIEKEFDDVLT